MAQYVDKSLARGERILMRGRWPVALWLAAWAALLVLGIAVIGVFIFLWASIKMSTTEFAVTDQRVILKRGFFRRVTEELAVESVEGVNLRQTFLGLLFGYGSIVVTGTGETHLHFPPMAQPVKFRRAIENARSLAKEVHIAPEDVRTLERAP